MILHLSYDNFISLFDDVEIYQLCDQQTCKDIAGEESLNIKLLVIGIFCSMGRAWTLDNIEEANGISRQVNCIFINIFMDYGSSAI